MPIELIGDVARDGNGFKHAVAETETAILDGDHRLFFGNQSTVDDAIRHARL